MAVVLLEKFPELMDSYKFAETKHKGQFRMGGLPYITHPLEVAYILYKKGFSLDFMKVGLFHDLFEDTDATYEEVRFLSNDEVLESTKQLTKVKPLDMISYLYSMGFMAKMVKLADRLHNLRSALVAPVKFRLRYIDETERYYTEFSKDTVFEDDIKEALDKLKESVIAA